MASMARLSARYSFKIPRKDLSHSAKQACCDEYSCKIVNKGKQRNGVMGG